MGVFRYAGLLLVWLLLWSCGGGETATGVRDSDVSSGVITGLGSVYVNGVRFNTDNTSVSLEDKPLDVGALDVGMVVVVEGHIDSAGSGVASRITVDQIARGKIRRTATENIFTVNGQTVLADRNTVYSANLPGGDKDLVDGDAVAVSGFVKTSGVVTATRIEKLDVLESPQIEGIVSSHVAAEKTFLIAAVLVRYNSAKLEAEVKNDAVLEVYGQFNDAGEFIATKIDAPGAGKLELHDKHVEIEGFVNHIIAANRFAINNVVVEYSTATEFRGGIGVNLQDALEVEGRYDNGVLVADSIQFRDGIEVEAQVNTVDPVAQSITLIGLDGINVFVNHATKLGGDIDLNSLTQGDSIRVRGQLTQHIDHGILAVELNLRSAGDRIILQAPLQSINEFEAGMLGLLFDTSAIPGDKYEVEGIKIGKQEFLTLAKPGDLIKLEGLLGQGKIDWEKINLDH